MAPQDIQNWLTFRTNNLQKQRLYLWHATKFDWIPLWSAQKGFQLLEQDHLPYDQVSYNQLTKSQWIQQNSLPTEAIQKLINKFNMNIDARKCTPVLNQQQQNGSVPATGQPYYLAHLESSPTDNIIFNDLKHSRHESNHYNHKMKKFNLKFLYFYKGTIHQHDTPRNDQQFKNIKDAVEQVDGGYYFYHEQTILYTTNSNLQKQ